VSVAKWAKPLNNEIFYHYITTADETVVYRVDCVIYNDGNDDDDDDDDDDFLL